MKYILILSIVLSSSQAFSQAFRGGGKYSNSSSGEESVTWTLGSWMTQKARFQLMDQWLAINKQANLLEFNIEGGQTNYDLTVGGNTKSHDIDRYSASLYISIFGLEGGYEESSEDTETRYGQFNVRILGQSSRSTQLIAGYGIQKKEDNSDNTEVTNQYANAKLQLYLVTFLGIDGTYKKLFPDKDNLFNTHEGERFEYGLFLEHKLIRLYGKVFEERTYVTKNGVKEKEFRDGVDAGIKLFF
jgi:hypothetical protein